MYTCSGNVHGSVHGQPRIEPRPWPSSPSALTNTLTCTVQLYCNYSYSLNKKYRQFGELPFQVSMLSASCMHACGISFRRRHVKERFKSENFPPFWILLILDVFLMHVPVPAAYVAQWVPLLEATCNTKTGVMFFSNFGGHSTRYSTRFFVTPPPHLPNNTSSGSGCRSFFWRAPRARSLLLVVYIQL
jgi:hypothetical protein